VLKHLSAGVYSEVADLISLLHGQAKPQIEATATDAAPETPANEQGV